MLRRNIVALIGLLAEVNGSKWLFDGKRLPTLGLHQLIDKSRPTIQKNFHFWPFGAVSI